MLAAADRPAGSFVHRKNVLGFRIACEEIWGESGLKRTVASLPVATRDATAGLIPLDTWIPVEFMIAWWTAIWEGPANRNEAQYRLYVASTARHGFGRVKKIFLRSLPPTFLAQHAANLWKEEYTTGSLAADVVSPCHLRGRLSDHPYVDNPLTRIAIAEALRTVVSLTRARDVTVMHAAHGSRLIIDVRWPSA